MTDFDRLGRRIAHEQDDLRARAPHRAQIRERIDALSIPHAPSLRSALRSAVAGNRGRWLAAGSGIAATAACAAIWLLLARGPAQPPIAAYAPRSGQPIAAYEPRSGKPIAVGAWIEAPGPEAFAIRFSDGTRVEIASHTRARLVEIDADGAHLLLESGRAHLEVAHRPHARWRVSAGPFAVHVIGTRFDVQWNPEQDRFQLDLAQGAVEVAGCAVGSGYHMRAGQRLEASCKRGRFDISAGASRRRLDISAGASRRRLDIAEATRAPAGAAADGSESAIAARSEAPPAATPAPATVPEASAQRGGKPRAQVGEFEARCANADVEALASLADAAHYAGDRARERYAWRLLRRRFPGTSRAALAAFALGRLEFDVHGSYSKAAEWFGAYLKEQPAGALVREARGRLMEATLRAGDARAARALGAAYLRDYPAGPHADLARSLEPTPAP